MLTTALILIVFSLLILVLGISVIHFRPKGYPSLDAMGTAEVPFMAHSNANHILNSIGDAIITTNEAGQIAYANQAAEHLLELHNKELQGKNLSTIMTLMDGESQIPLKNPITRCLENGPFNNFDMRNQLKLFNGKKIPVQQSVAPIYNKMGHQTGVVLVIRDISEFKSLSNKMRYFTTHDQLTGLINRKEFENALQNALHNVKTNNTPSALIFIDLDRFNTINEICGHAGGDEFLKQLSLHLSHAIRDGDILSRLGSDEFAVLLRGCHLEDAKQAAARFQEVVNLMAFTWSGRIFHVGASIGITPLQSEFNSVSDALTAADTVCNVAKELGGNRTYIYNPQDELVQRHHHHLRYIETLKQALRDDRFFLTFQPIVSLTDNQEPRHVEILLRLINPEGETIFPNDFIPTAERYHLMPAIDRWVIENLFKYIHQQARHLHPQMIFTINLSGQSLGEEDLLTFILKMIDQYQVNPHQICFEITETAAIANFSDACHFITVLRGLGCCFALDDFGNGLSSFNYLKKLEVDYIKIDGSFITNMTKNEKDQALVESINNIGHLMGMKTIAEFVETEDTIKALKNIKVDYGQGYIYARPRPLLELAVNGMVTRQAAQSVAGS